MVMMVVMMVMMAVAFVHIQALLLLPMHRNLHMGPQNPTLFRRRARYSHPRQVKGIHAADESVCIIDQLQKGPHEHIARGAHGTFQIKGFHPILLGD